MLARRFESYKALVVRRFFANILRASTAKSS